MNQLIPIDNIQNCIFTVRGKQVMLDRDLADLYDVTVKRLNEQVKRNINRFPDKFRFQLTDSEYEILRSQFATIKDNNAIITSLKDLGKKWFAFSKMEIEAIDVIKKLNEELDK